MAFLLAFNNQTRILSPFIIFHRCLSSTKLSFKEHEVCFKSCGNLYRKWREEKRFRNVPSGDLNFKIKYFDNGNVTLKTNSAPVIVIIHGAPGSYKDFVDLISYFKKKARIIVPNFPDLSVYKPGIFRFSDEEKAQLTKDFLAAISVSQIDALIVHSSGVYPSLHLCLDDNIPVKSLIMLNPATYNFDKKTLKILNVMRRVAAASEVPIIFKTFEYLGPILLKLQKVPFGSDKFLDNFLSMLTTVHSNYPEAKARFYQLSQKKLPMLFAFSRNDRILGVKYCYDLANLLGASNAEIYTYDKNGIMINEGKSSSVLKVMEFEKGTHYVFWKHADIIHKAIEDFLRQNAIIV